MKFYLGTHEPGWLERVDFPLFLSRRRLERQHARPRARAPWALDSGGFTELSLRGAWYLSARSYALLVAEYVDEIGLLEWAAPQDWMCEPHVLHKTGLSVAEHQRRTVANFLDLRGVAPQLPFVPVLQGWEPSDYARCVEAYDAAGVDLTRETVVGVGSVCRRQGDKEAVAVFDAIDRALPGLRLHGFGFKVKGLRLLGDRLASADSLAWSFRARKVPRLPGCDHKTCANCLRFAVRWRDRLLKGAK